jgi:hypothetical protein
MKANRVMMYGVSKLTNYLDIDLLNNPKGIKRRSIAGLFCYTVN